MIQSLNNLQRQRILRLKNLQFSIEMQKSKFSQNRYSSQGLNSLRSLKSSNCSLLTLQAMNKRMEGESKEAMNFLQQLKKQRSMQNKASKVVGDGIDQIEKNGKFYASRLEEERNKHKNLQALVKYYEDMLYQDKMSRYEQEKSQIKKFSTDRNSKRDQEFEKSQNMSRQRELTELTATLKQLQRTYDDLVLKSNTSSYELSKKMDQVRILRSERTVCSGLFDQFQRQLFEHQLLYKKLLIQRTVLDSIFTQKVVEFNRLQEETKKHCEKLIDKNKKLVFEEKKRMIFYDTEKEENPNDQS